ncbi:MAG: T9SS type A sorting domain-containing protein [Bacteroidia bacterium]|nr:T9SS type A sorting domain-containing protein [Bacteroidia bacterium]
MSYVKTIITLALCAVYFKGIAQVTITPSNVQKAKCFGICDGQITFSISGATGPFSVAITNTPGCTNPTVTPFAGPTVTFTNICQCNAFITTFSFYDGTNTFIGNSYGSFGSGATAPLTVSANVVPATCSSCCNGSVYCQSTGGNTSSGPTTFSIDGVYLAWQFWPALNVCPGTHTLCGVDNFGCTVCTTFTMGFSTTGIEEYSLANGSVIPNPANGKFTFSGKIDEGSEFIITSATGLQIQRRKSEKYSTSIEFDISEVESGIYFLHYISKAGERTITKVLVY